MHSLPNDHAKGALNRILRLYANGFVKSDQAFHKKVTQYVSILEFYIAFSIVFRYSIISISIFWLYYIFDPDAHIFETAVM